MFAMRTTVRIVNTTPDEGPARRDTEHVQSLERGLAVIRAFDRDHSRMTLSQVAARAGLNRAVARRLLLTLSSLGYVESDGREFRLRAKMLELGYGYLSSIGLPEIAEPHLRQLSLSTGESTSIAVLEDDNVVYVARVVVSRIMSLAIGVGTRLPAAATSLGRAMLAYTDEEFVRGLPLPAHTPHTLTDHDELAAVLAQVRERGWALVDQELELGLRSVAAPLRDASGRVVAALNVSASARRGTLAQIEDEIVAPLCAAAAAIEADLRRGGVRL